MMKQKGPFDLKQRHIQKIYQERLKYGKSDKTREIKDTFLFIGIVLFGIFILGILELFLS
ncbi:hypothetical protein J7E71_04260 [Mesobacillus foraminis]|uniref:hypothetical protein n=1 Tax=Mesobacillus foraminis TaxID=279826 RepID=UPI001BED1330|nr:hypothetical protein [Mesobacillus foraminis]MBT2755168.1 hypothetical protein [Mesobacillus foraminis]